MNASLWPNLEKGRWLRGVPRGERRPGAWGRQCWHRFGHRRRFRLRNQPDLAAEIRVLAEAGSCRRRCGTIDHVSPSHACERPLAALLHLLFLASCASDQSPRVRASWQSRSGAMKRPGVRTRPLKIVAVRARRDRGRPKSVRIGRFCHRPIGEDQCLEQRP